MFTHPDQTITRMFFSELAGSYDLTDDIELSGNAYFRQNRLKTFNGDDSDFDDCADDSGLLCDAAGEFPVVDINDNLVLADDTSKARPTIPAPPICAAGAARLQSMFNQDWFDHENNLIVGASYDYADVHFASDTELAQLTDDRGTIGSGILVRDARVRLNTNTETYGFYLERYVSRLLII